MLYTLLLALSTGAAALQLASIPAQRSTVRHAAPCMKGKGSRGIPGNRGGFNAGGGLTPTARAKMERQDFEKSTEWTLVAEKEELGPEMGAALAVEAGQSPMGQSYIWALRRGTPVEEGANPEDSVIYATDGTCRTCLFPLTKGEVTPLKDEEGYEGEGKEDGHALTCGLCGTKYNLVTGEVRRSRDSTSMTPDALMEGGTGTGPGVAAVLSTSVGVRR